MSSSPKLSMRKRGFWRLSSLLIIICILAMVLSPHVHAVDNFAWSSNLVFLLPAYNSTVGFSTTSYFDSFTWDSDNATQITFTNIYTSGDTLASFTVSTTTNLTITQLMVSSKLIFTTVDAGTITLSLPSNPVSMTFDGNPQGSPTWDGTSATITTLADSTVTLDWTPAETVPSSPTTPTAPTLTFVTSYKGHDIWQIFSNGIYVFYVDTNSTVTWPLLADVEAYIDSLGVYVPPIIVSPTDYNNPKTYTAIVIVVGAVLVLGYAEKKKEKKLSWKKGKAKNTKWKRENSPWKILEGQFHKHPYLTGMIL